VKRGKQRVLSRQQSLGIAAVAAEAAKKTHKDTDNFLVTVCMTG
jgi:hypothetical protein